jgi:hypothetical protein
MICVDAFDAISFHCCNDTVAGLPSYANCIVIVMSLMKSMRCIPHKYPNLGCIGFKELDAVRACIVNVLICQFVSGQLP